MQLLVISWVFDQKLLINGYVNLDITSKIFEKKSALINMNN